MLLPPRHDAKFSCRHPTPPIVLSPSAERPLVKRFFSDSSPSNNARTKKCGQKQPKLGGGGWGGWEKMQFTSVQIFRPIALLKFSLHHELSLHANWYLTAFAIMESSLFFISVVNSWSIKISYRFVALSCTIEACSDSLHMQLSNTVRLITITAGATLFSLL